MTLLLERLKNFFTRYKSFEDWVFSTRFLEFLFLTAALGLSGLVRYLGIRFESGDYLAYLSDWYDYITAHNYWLALKDNFSNYNPPYLYLLIITSSFGGDKLISIKLISIIFDYILAVLVYFVVKNLIKNKTSKSENQNQLIPAKSIPILAFFSILFSPNIILNSAVWSQSDVIYTVFLVASFWFLLKDKFIWTIVFFTIAVSFKLQAIFLIPILAVLFVKRKITLLHLLVAPVVYLIMMLPAAIAGKSWEDIFKVYTEQGNAYQDLTKNAPSLWALFGGADYEIFSKFGFGLAGIFVLGLVYLFWKKDIQDKAQYWLNLGLISAVAIPWFLPKMHDRYFFVADVLSIIYAFYFPKKFWLAIVINLTSFLVYTNYLFGSETVSLPILSLVIFGVIVYLLYSNLNKIYKEKATTV